MLDALPISCLRPLYVKNPRFRYPLGSEEYERSRALHYRDYLENYYIEVPCGKCYLCRKKKSNGWRIRLLEECKTTPKFRDCGIDKYRIIFVCFTYDDVHLPSSGTRDQFAAHIRKWRDLWRKKYGCSPRYFAITDRGSQFGRLHLHLLIFAPYSRKEDRYLTIEELEQNNFFWRNGQARKPSWLESEKGVSYVCGYMTGSNLEKDAVKHGKPICKESLEYIPYIFVSNGLGKSFVDNPTLSIDPSNGNMLYRYNGYYYGLPSYYRYKLIDDEFRWHTNLLLKREKEEYVLFNSDNIRYSFLGTTMSRQNVDLLYRSSLSKYDSDNNKYIKLSYAK